MLYIFNDINKNDIQKIKVFSNGKLIYLRIKKYLPIVKILIPKKYKNLKFFINEIEIQPSRAREIKRTLKEPLILKNKDTNYTKKISLHLGGNHKQYASISPSLGKMYFNDKFCNLPLFWKIFIIYHEYGHLYYRDEIKADTFAFYHFIKNGYPESQAVLCYTAILQESGANLKRIKNLLNLNKWVNTNNI